MKTHYDTLQVSRLASFSVIEASWKTLMLEHHPDRGGDAQRAQEINAAHDILSDPERRAAYDRQLFERSGPRPFAQPNQYSSANPAGDPVGAYPPAHPSAFDPGRVLQNVAQEVLSEFQGDIQEAVERANFRVLEGLAASNPLLRTLVDRYRQEQAAKRKRSGGGR